MPWDSGLSGTQLNIAAYRGSPLHVVAGAGTGKSFALKRKVARLLEEGVSPAQILAVTFTRTAARDLVDDLQGLNVPGCTEVDARTLHSLCFRILGVQQVFEITGRVPRPLLDFETRYMLYDMGNKFGGLRERRKRLKAFEASWARLQDEDPGWPSSDIDRAFENALSSWLRFHESMLIGELVPETWRYLRNNPQSPERRRYAHILVDEYQDLNRSEQELVRLLSDEPLDGNGSLTVVGDDDQSIYSWRYAQPEGIVEFPNDYPGTQTETLVNCRRCPTKIVHVANDFLTWSRGGQKGKVLQEDINNGEGELHIVQWNSLEEEADGLASFVASQVKSSQVEQGDVLILTPRRLIGYKIRDALNRAGIAAISCFNEDMLNAEMSQERFALLTLLARPSDRVALRTLLGMGSSNACRGHMHG